MNIGYSTYAIVGAPLSPLKLITTLNSAVITILVVVLDKWFLSDA